MPKTIRNVFDKKLSYDALYSAHIRARKNKMLKKEIILFELDLETNLARIYKNLKNGTYHVGKYREFIVKEPKERLIKSLPYKDRIVHQWYVYEFIKPYIIPRLIKDTYACIETRGTHKAKEALQKYMRLMKRDYGSYYIVKCDVAKYFNSIDKDILVKIMSKFIGDKKLLSLTKKFIYDNEERKGIPIGNYTSQYFANIYLSVLDSYIKHDLKIKYYVRYMDDFVLLVKTKSEAKEVLAKIRIFLRDKLKLNLNSKSNYYPNKMGCNFCGYRIFETHVLLRKRSKQKIKQRVRMWNALAKEKRLDMKKYEMQLNSWLGHAKHADSYNLINLILSRINVD